MNSVVGATMETRAATAMEITGDSISIAAIDDGVGARLEPTSTEQPTSCQNIAVSWNEQFLLGLGIIKFLHMMSFYTSVGNKCHRQYKLQRKFEASYRDGL